MKSDQYGDDFYKNRHTNTIYSAEQIIPILSKIVPKIKSAIDLGCGVGTWLHVLQTQIGVDEICGVDGNWVNYEHLKIDRSNFIQHDLTKDSNPEINRRFDLAVSLEVAEHLPPTAADPFVHTLTSLSDFILFSAAVPWQDGTGHLNEQWPNYWIALFEARDYIAIDAIRRKIRYDEKILHWYRQNTLIFVKRDRLSDLNLEKALDEYTPVESYSLTFEKAIAPLGIKQSINSLTHAIKRRLKRR